MKYPKDKVLLVPEARDLLEQEFRERILSKNPDINEKRFMDLVEAFLRGYDKAIAVYHNILHPDLKLCCFDEDIFEDVETQKDFEEVQYTNYCRDCESGSECPYGSRCEKCDNGNLFKPSKKNKC